jgi:hypothetical protein
VLAHELGHAYSHVGSDADDRYWSSDLFHASDLELKEGLAQYYTMRICQRLADSHPTLLKTFEELLKHQPRTYQVHTEWENATAERVRLAMLETRRTHVRGTLEDFKARLVIANDQLANAPTDRVQKLW